MVQKKKNGEEVVNQEKLEDYVKSEFDTMEVVLRGDRDESRIRVFVGAEIDQVIIFCFKYILLSLCFKLLPFSCTGCSGAIS